ncbi:nicotinate-nucleotide-dimethylbenzimidazole phosphoribosyltransferase [Reichenbachiella agariperforans]|uniref:Nicotinate-nucleotide--dimethylbenzimidazole phosphoribosyltransferase n=1 Tax=Reichenbachiella agariperforans TaxID=156994 RepID=A0A1M6STV6_REIAG|nr:nicotinate-nucleotide--dimethylbenzimidazole phosphoribosyltransferase [Reichenbachiella agariperforans]SHK48096.1 nicotinate-nucleotide-dimethylbenzimidazole phosphoribosyltransferase [Reichenbachiella agariperforans]
MKNYFIEKPSQTILDQVKNKIDLKTKPLGSLGQLESIAKKICLIQQTRSPKLNHPAMLVFAGDHGLTDENISAFPQEVTHQMVLNFLSGGAAINVFCQQNQINLSVVDAGVNHTFAHHPDLIDRKIGFGTANSLHEEAMTDKEFNQAMAAGAQLVDRKFTKGCNIIGFGEMGIGNTSASSLLMSAFTDCSLEDCVGRGTGIDDQGLHHKIDVLQKVYAQHRAKLNDPLTFFRCVAGFEMAMMLGAMVQAAENKMILLIDGFIASAVFLAAYQQYPNLMCYALFCHQSDEHGHQSLLDHLGQEPILKMNLRLGEGTGCALAYPIIQSSVAFINQMASFESASITNKP